MKRLVSRGARLTAIAIALWASAAAAQAPEVPKHACGPAPEWPGKLASDNVKRGFERKMKTFGDCIRAYVNERQAAIKANEVSAQAAIDEYNGAIKQERADREREQPTK